MQKLQLQYLLIVFIGLIIFTGCEDDSDSISRNTKEINHFIYNNMSFYYYWNDKIPNLDPDKESDPEEFFNKLLNTDEDHWSFITDDYKGLMSYFNGVELSMGMSFKLYLMYENSSQIYGIIEYVNEDGPADRAGIQRGDVFNMIDGSVLNTSNYYDLLTQDEYTITFGTITTSGITPISPSINLIAEELTTNPIHYSDILNINGKQTGYLMLNAFQQNNELELESLFADFKSHNISELILDFRYNPGGAISTAKLLASLIGPSSIANEVMINTSYNDDVEHFIKTEISSDDSMFVERFIELDNNLDLSRIFALTTDNTASASEMVMYCLEPYMEVIQIGSQTHGKYYGSITIYDKEKHNWAMQPIIMRSENITNSIDYSQGLLPNYKAEDDYWHPIGDPQEEMLAKAINLIQGNINSTHLKSSNQRILESKFKKVLTKNNKLKPEPIMIVDKKLEFLFSK